MKLLLVFCYTILAAIIYFFLYRQPTVGIDDANIYFVYMKNVANGYGFVYNVSGERVEGFTSLLWTLIGALVFKINIKPELCLMMINIFIITIALWRLVVFIDNYYNDRRLVSPYSFLLLGILFAVPGYFDWTILTLMETGLWSCLLILSIVNLCSFTPENLKKSNLQLAALLVLIVLARPESLLWGPVFLFVRFIQLLKQKQNNIPASLLGLSVPLLSFVATIILLTLWRLQYFGYPLPNTYYAKVSNERIQNIKDGLVYDFHYLRYFNPFMLLGAFYFLVVVIRAAIKKELNSLNPVLLILALITFTTFAIPLFAGGDHFGEARFIQPTVPMLYLFIIVAITDNYNFMHLPIRRMIEFAVLILVISLGFHNKEIVRDFDIAEEARNYADKLNLFFKENKGYPSHAVFAAGGTAYEYKGITVDVLGLNNVEMAHAEKTKSTSGLKNHASFNRNVFLKQRPEIVGFFWPAFISDTTNFTVPENRSGFKDGWIDKISKGIFSDSTFQATYDPAFIFKRGEKECLFTYASKDFLKTLNPQFYHYCVIPRE